MNWYETRYVNRRDWVLEHLEVLKLTGNEVVVVLIVDFMNQFHLTTTPETIAKKSGLSFEETDKALSSLLSKGYMNCTTAKGTLRFTLDGLYNTDTAREENALDQSVFDMFEKEFRRPLTPVEAAKLSDLNRDYDRKMIFYALREASASGKVNLPYVERWLKFFTDNGISAQMIQDGTYYENAKNYRKPR